MKISVTEKKDFLIVEFNLESPITPDFLKSGYEKNLPLPFGKGVVISGRGPIWLYAHLVHYFHPAKWVGVYDPRLGGAVVVQSHDPSVAEGDVIKID